MRCEIKNLLLWLRQQYTKGLETARTMNRNCTRADGGNPFFLKEHKEQIVMTFLNVSIVSIIYEFCHFTLSESAHRQWTVDRQNKDIKEKTEHFGLVGCRFRGPSKKTAEGLRNRHC